MDKCDFEYLGPYKIQSVLGRGGMGAVYKGLHAKSGEAVAIKVISPGVANQLRFRRRFNAEIETLMRLRHPNIVQLVGVGEEQGLLFYVMEFVDGHSLHDHLRQYKRIDWTEAIQIGVDVTAALKHAHDLGIIHRDIKPANLMVNKEGRIKLTDFGIAKLFGSTDMTAAGSVIGTADYMPPEQAEGKGVTVRSDLYSLGSVMFALLSGRPPFAGKSVPEVLYAVRYSPAPDSTQFAPEAPMDLHALISEMLEKDPLKRPPTALVVGNRLKAIQQGMARLEAERNRNQSASDQPLTDRNIAKELTSIDLNDDQDEELKATNHMATQDQPTAIASDSLIERLGREDAAATKPRHADAETDLSVEIHKTAPSQGLALPSTETPFPASTSHYTPITDADTRKYTTELYPSPNEKHVQLIQYLSIAAMVVLLLAVLGAAWYMFLPPTADALHKEIMVAIESGDDNELSASIPAMSEFVEQFPDDARTGEVKQWLDQAELARVSRLIRRRARNGTVELSAIEQGFLACLEAMEREPGEARRKFDAFLAVYKNASDLSITDRRYVELAEHASESLANARRNPTSAAAIQLEATIHSAEKTMPKAQLAVFYRSLVELYSDKPWAKDVITRIKARQAE